MNAVSLFSGAGIGEAYLKDVGINVVAANELVDKRAKLYSSLYNSASMVQGDINNSNAFNNLISGCSDNIDLILASPPCQGMSIAGSSRGPDKMLNDHRNYLIYSVIKVINRLSPAFVIIENVPSLLKLLLLYKGRLVHIHDILFNELGHQYNIEADILNAADYGVPQTRNRAIIKLFKKSLTWGWPSRNKMRSVKETIGHLPSIESGETSKIKWHFARKHDKRHVLWMKNTPTGKSAFENIMHYPKKPDGTLIKGYNTTYRRMLWDKPAPTITIRNDAISSQRNVHPGRPQSNGTYSDARVLTPLELMLLTSLPHNWSIPDNTPELLIRQCIGESVPPVMLKSIIGEINH